MQTINPEPLRPALLSFRAARRKANLALIWGRLTGQPVFLYAYEDVRDKLQGTAMAQPERRTIPLDAIVGSVGRYEDFTRHFLPLRIDPERWAKVAYKSVHGGGVPPIDVYQIGDAYFVLDGNHRVSVARAQGNETIEAYVTPVETKVPFSPSDSPDDLIVKGEYTDFLEATELDVQRPASDFSVSLPGQYRVLGEQIALERLLLEQERGRPVTEPEAAAVWHDDTYAPIVALIRSQGLLRDFPGRTETDLYVWIFRHRARLADAYGWEIEPETVVGDLIARYSRRPQRALARLRRRLTAALTPAALASNPRVGEWRRERSRIQRRDRLFTHILVPIDRNPTGWHALDQALLLAARENSHIHGLAFKRADTSADELAALQAAFDARCQAAGLQGECLIESGPAVRAIVDHARWCDIVVTGLQIAPGAGLRDRLQSRFGRLIRQTPRPLVAVPHAARPWRHALVAFDNSPKAWEALYLAAYLAEAWGLALTLLTAERRPPAARTLAGSALDYLAERAIDAPLVTSANAASDAILTTALERDCDVVIMGGYGSRPMSELFVGSTVDRVLRMFGRPVLICR